MEIILAIAIGGLFGFVLHKAGATDPQYILGMLRLRNLHLMKTILLAVGVSSLGLFLLLALGVDVPGKLSVKPSHLGVLLGGAIFGVGFALAGYCPGTGVCAAGTGRRDALFFVGGGLLGALAYTLVHGSASGAGLLAELGGTCTLATTGADGYGSLTGALPGLLVAGGLGLAMVGLARWLPHRLGGARLER
jgi:uncharacterized membrane protein YedE/YeeE